MKLSVIAALSVVLCAGQTSNQTPEKQAWEKVDSLSKASLASFLKEFPSGELAQSAALAIELQDRFAAIRSGKSKPQVLVPLAALGERWKNWQRRNARKSVEGYSVSRTTIKNGKATSGTGLLLSAHSDKALSGGATPGLGSTIFDGSGAQSSPTGDGSIITFQTNDFQFEYLKGIIITTAGKGTMYFGVWGGQGLVHLKGTGSVTLPDGRKIDLK
jgi:hypothetical protein